MIDLEDEESSIFDLEAERASAEDALERLQETDFSPYVISLVERRLNEVTAEIERFS